MYGEFTNRMWSTSFSRVSYGSEIGIEVDFVEGWLFLREECSYSRKKHNFMTLKQ